jgi:5-methylcytosine-specific restriction endonuclease McrA
MPYSYKQPGNWKTTRRRILARDGHACYICGAPSNEVDHILAVTQGGTHDDTNLAAICTPHHEAKSKAERVAGQRAARRRKLEARQEPHPGVVTPHVR